VPAPVAGQYGPPCGISDKRKHGTEVAALAAQFQQQALQATSGVTDGDAWVGVLKEADAVGYRTWILLPTQPSTW
jgi:hypothetical protein